METATSKTGAGDTVARDLENETLTDYCSRPKCRNEFRRQGGRGRRQEYCSDICRRTAEKELRQTKSRLEHFEGLVEQLRNDVKAFGKTEDADTPSDRREQASNAWQVAEGAVRRADGALVFADPEDLVVQELRRLRDAVSPLISAHRSTG